MIFMTNEHQLNVRTNKMSDSLGCDYTCVGTSTRMSTVRANGSFRIRVWWVWQKTICPSLFWRSYLIQTFFENTTSPVGKIKKNQGDGNVLVPQRRVSFVRFQLFQKCLCALLLVVTSYPPPLCTPIRSKGLKQQTARHQLPALLTCH